MALAVMMRGQEHVSNAEADGTGGWTPHALEVGFDLHEGSSEHPFYLLKAPLTRAGEVVCVGHRGKDVEFWGSRRGDQPFGAHGRCVGLRLAHRFSRVRQCHGPVLCGLRPTSAENEGDMSCTGDLIHRPRLLTCPYWAQRVVIETGRIACREGSFVPLREFY